VSGFWLLLPTSFKITGRFDIDGAQNAHLSNVGCSGETVGGLIFAGFIDSAIKEIRWPDHCRSPPSRVGKSRSRTCTSPWTIPCGWTSRSAAKLRLILSRSRIRYRSRPILLKDALLSSKIDYALIALAYLAERESATFASAREISRGAELRSRC
jgi:hypothetical protein